MKVESQTYKSRNDPMEAGIHKSKAFFMSTQGLEIGYCLGDNISSQQNNNSSQICLSSFDIHVDLGVSTWFLGTFCFFSSSCRTNPFISLCSCAFCWNRVLVFFCFSSILLQPWIFRPDRPRVSFLDLSWPGYVDSNGFTKQLGIILYRRNIRSD